MAMQKLQTSIESMNVSVEKMRSSCKFGHNEEKPIGPRQLRLVKVKREIERVSRERR